MAKQHDSIVTFGLSGKVGDLLVFRRRDGKTVVAKVPYVSSKVSEAQLAHRRRFQRAAVYGNVVEANAEKKAAYAAKAKKGWTVFNAAADFLNAPDIDTIDLSGYTEQPGDPIRIIVTDDYRVQEVKAVITNDDGFAQPGVIGYEWLYTATQVNENLSGDRIEVFASDTPGNILKILNIEL
jgi:hypothetical protein